MDDTELIQIVDEQDNPVKGDTRISAWSEGLFHRIVYIMVEDAEGKILLQKRGKNISTFPNCWDIAAAGHVDFGENYEEAAWRELAEELGVTGLKLEQVGKYRSSDVFEDRKLNRFNMVYRVVVPHDTTFRLQASEVAGIEWFEVQAVKDMVQINPKEVTNGLKGVMAHFYP
jgi:16S rRNA (adenine1518-N6/adenine1519-N6)-dimethyltransferase